MPTYTILQNPGHNRVYFKASRILSMYELSLTMPMIKHLREEESGGVPYLVFDTDAELTSHEIRQLSRLSCTYAVYRQLDDKSLLPVTKDSGFSFNDDISMHLKYTGKTNELFTRFMLNIAIRYMRAPAEKPRILDPVCGKGTTLFESLLQGYHAYGIEIDDKMAHEAYIFYKKYLETAKIKHVSHTEKVGGQDRDGKKFSATRYQVALTNNKIDFEVVAGNTLHVNTFYKKNYIHAIVGDLPYGVQHVSTGSKKNSRNAIDMLTHALPEWLKVLKPGGVVALSWNLFLIPCDEMESLFMQHRLTIPEEIKGKFTHRVDQAINRDLIVGVKS